MKTIKLAIAAVLFAVSFINVQAQTAEEIIKNYFQTIDSEGKLSTLQGMKINAILNQGMEIPVEIVQLKGGKTYIKITIQGKEIIQMASDGETMWTTNFMTQKAEKLDSQTTENAKLSNQDFPDPLLDYQSKGYSVEYLGKETKEGTECYKIKLTKLPLTIDGEKVEDSVFYYFDTENNIPILTETQINDGPMKGQMSTSTFSDYQEVDGIYYPFDLGMFGQNIQVKSVTLNPEIDPKVFGFIAE